jgi:hypothetical protein
MKINTKIFGKINFNLAEGIYTTKQIELNNKSLNCDLYVEEDSFENKETQVKEAFELIDKLETLVQDAKKKLIQEKQNSNDIIQPFIEFHFDELREELEQKFPGISHDNFLDFIKLRSVNLIGDEEDENKFVIQLDFCIDKDLSDELLVVNFNKRGKIINIAHES